MPRFGTPEMKSFMEKVYQDCLKSAKGSKKKLRSGKVVSIKGYCSMVAISQAKKKFPAYFKDK